MNCKFCNAELEEGVTLCPACGKDNEIVEEPVEVVIEVTEEMAAEEEVSVEEIVEETTEEAAAEEVVEEPKKKAPKWLVALAIVGGIAIAAILGLAVYFGIQSSAAAADSYSVSDSKAINARDTVVATVGDVELTNSALQVYYWQAANEFQSTYGYYVDASVLDFTKPLDEQYYDAESGITWQKYFLDSAISSWSRYAALYMHAKEEGFQLSEEMKAYVESLPEQAQEMAASYGFESLDAMLLADMGAACDEAGYLQYLDTNIYASQYMDAIYESLIPTREEIETYYAENEEALNAQNIIKDDSVTVDVRHILISPEGGTVNENGETVYSEAEWEQCRVKAQELLDKWAAESGTEEGFAQFAAEHTQDAASASSGGLYTDVYVGKMVEPFENWCFDPARQYGDTDLVQTVYGYHIMYFVASREVWATNVSDTMIYERSMKIVDDAAAKWPATVNDNKIVLSTVTAEVVE